VVAESQVASEIAAREDLLPAADLAHLRLRELRFQAQPDGNMVDLIIFDYPLPAGFDYASADLLIQLPMGWPDAKADMWYFDPWLRISRTGAYPPAAEVPGDIAGRRWQRWSRHFPQANWKAGTDSLASYLALVDRELAKAIA
jgi:hypothetical protein